MKQVPRVREEAFLEWSRFLGSGGQPREAIQIAQRALEIFPQGMFRDQLIELAQMPVENPVAAADRELTAPFSDVQDELKALGYDLPTMTEDQLRDYDEYVDGTLDKARAERPNMSDFEYLTLQAKLIKEWVLKNLKPTLPQKTNDTSTIVAPEVAP